MTAIGIDPGKTIGLCLYDGERVLAAEQCTSAAEAVRWAMSCKELREAVETWPELDHLRRLRAAVLWWPYRTHEQYCATRADADCNCGWGNTNAARREARHLVGLPDDVGEP